MTAMRALTLPRSSAVLLGAMALYAAVVGTACHLRYLYYGYDDFDLAIHAQSVRNILHGTLDSSILGIPFLGNHMVLLLFPLAPLYLLWPSALLLLWLQTLVLAAGAWMLFRLARLELPDRWALFLALAYLVYPPLVLMNLYEFHPIALASTFLLGALLALRRDRFGLFALCCLLALACQENVALLLIGLAVYALAAGKRGRWFWVPLLAGVGYFAVVVLWALPRLNPVVGFASLYAHWGDSVPHAALNMLRHPLRVCAELAEPRKLTFLTLLLGPLAFAPLLCPLRCAPLLPVLLQRLLSNRDTETTVLYHYQAEFIPFLFFAASGALAGLLRSPKRRVALAAVAAGLALLDAAAFVTYGTPRKLVAALHLDPEQSALRQRDDAALAALPPNAPVLATFEFLPRLSGRARLYSLHHVCSGHYTLSAAPYPTPSVDWIILDVYDRLTFESSASHKSQHYQRLQQLVTTPGWRIVRHEDGVLVFGRTGAGDPPQSLLQTQARLPENLNTHVGRSPPGLPAMLGFTLTNSAAVGVRTLTLYWQTGPVPPVDFDLRVELQNSGRRWQGRIAPGSRVFPPQSWPTNCLVADRQPIRVDLPPDDPHLVLRADLEHPGGSP